MILPPAERVPRKPDGRINVHQLVDEFRADHQHVDDAYGYLLASYVAAIVTRDCRRVAQCLVVNEAITKQVLDAMGCE